MTRTRLSTPIDKASLEGIPETASRLKISKFTLRRWIRQRRLAHYRLGRRVVLSQADVEQFLAANRVEPLGRNAARSG
jgi:excisionase family DNA binding protein